MSLKERKFFQVEKTMLATSFQQSLRCLSMLSKKTMKIKEQRCNLYQQLLSTRNLIRVIRECFKMLTSKIYRRTFRREKRSREREIKEEVLLWRVNKKRAKRKAKRMRIRMEISVRRFLMMKLLALFTSSLRSLCLPQ